jgi:hypothetical protein
MEMSAICANATPVSVRSRRKPDIALAAVNVGVGRIARLRGSPWEGPESAPKPPFHCKREIDFAALLRRSLSRLRKDTVADGVTRCPWQRPYTAPCAFT